MKKAMPPRHREERRALPSPTALNGGDEGARLWDLVAEAKLALREPYTNRYKS